MILLVPISPEVPKVHRKGIWPGLVLVIILCVGYLEVHDRIVADNLFVDQLYDVASVTENGVTLLKPEAQQYLTLRPLLRIAPAPANWSWDRLFYANFIHGGALHLFLNLIGAFAGARILATFMPFLCALAIFIIGGSAGLLSSLLCSHSDYVPHVGASAGIFAMMGAYYVYNFRFRTRYFFWFPSRRGVINLKTSTYFFLDVVLLELVLTLAQLSPTARDSIDHLAHVFGFAAGAGLALILRLSQRWPQFLQTRSEYMYWSKSKNWKEVDPLKSQLGKWIELLYINPYNDHLKLKAYRRLYNRVDRVPPKELETIISFMSPTFIRLHPEDTAAVIKEVLAKRIPLPKSWLEKTPYDSIIRAAKFMTDPPEERYYLFEFVTQYQRAQPHSPDIERKIELLTTKLKPFLEPGASAMKQWEKISSGSSGTDNVERHPSLETPDSPPEKGKKVS